MSSNEPIVPKEVIAFFKDKKCPRCNSCLGKINYFHRKIFPGYYSVAWCEANHYEHYEYVINFEDPKKINKEEESIDIFDDNYRYQIKKLYDNEVYDTQIVLYPLDDELNYKGYLFSNLNIDLKMSDEKLIKKINMLLLFR